MADLTDSVSDLQDHGVALSNNNNDFSSDNNSDCGQPTCVGDDDGEELVLEPGVCDPDHMEERFRVDRKKLEEMLQAAQDGKAETGEEFFQRIMQETDTRITWPSKLKIGAKSKKDPHIKVTGKIENISASKDKIMSVLDTKSNRVTLKMDVSYTEHSHVIGKGGNIIKKVMKDTRCHIHFPDSNRGSQQEKSNQVSIAGQIGGVEQARAKVRELLPLVLVFELPISNNPTPDINSPTIQQIVQVYNIGVNMKQRARGYSTTVTVRGSSSNAAGIKEGTLRLMEHLIGNLGVTLPVSTQIEIAPQHHQFMSGRGGLNVKQIMQGTNATIHFPDPNSAQRKSTVFISGPVDSVIIARHLLMGCLPLVLMFDIRDEVEVEATKLAQLMEQLDVFISIKPKPRQPSKSVIVKSIERNAANMYRARQALLGQECESCAANCNSTTRGLNGLLNSNVLNVKAGLLSVNGVNGLSRVSPLQSPRNSISGQGSLAWPAAVSQQNSFPTTVTPVLISQQTLNPLLISQNTQQQSIPNPHTTTSQTLSNPTQHNPALNPNPSLHLARTTTPTSPPPLVNQAPVSTIAQSIGLHHPPQSAADPVRAYVVSTPVSAVTNTVANTEHHIVPHRVILQSGLRVNNHPEPRSLLASTKLGTDQQQHLTYLPQSRLPHPDMHRAAHPTPEQARIAHPSPRQVTHPTSPPPGLTQGDPKLLSTELARLEMAHRAARLISSCGGAELTEHITQASKLDRQISSPAKEKVMSGNHSNTSSSTSPAQSPCNSPINLVTITTASPITSLQGVNNNNNKMGTPSNLVDLDYLQNNISPNNSSGNLSGVLIGSRGRGTMNLLSDSKLGFAPGGGSALHTNSRRSSESGGDSDSSDKRAPGCERRDWEREREWGGDREQERQEEMDRLTLQSTSTSYSVDYNHKKLLASKAMKRKPIVSEVRRPTDTWSGLGFSKSMPESAIREQRKPNGFSLFQRETLPTTYENSLKEETEMDGTESSWPPDQSSPSDDSMNSPQHELQTSAAPGEYPANRKKKVTYTNLSCSNYIDGSSLPRQTKGLWPSEDSTSQTATTKPDLGELFFKLGLGKYADVFQQQEIDLSTFLTLTDNDLKELGITTFGARRRMRLAISDLNKNPTKPFQFGFSNTSSSLLNDGSNGSNGLLHSTHGHENTTSVW
ncbi:protein bicaudal C homolog 1-like isoform X2 [Asterias amurensis]|uniref:protein bicaudal C homolog 1-like isoform X2 n=1 Tax=Asterias amurensis TaxID=7602 RepID=UPI003AB71E3F